MECLRKIGISMMFFLFKKIKLLLVMESRIVVRFINLVVMEIYLLEYNFIY